MAATAIRSAPLFLDVDFHVDSFFFSQHEKSEFEKNKANCVYFFRFCSVRESIKRFPNTHEKKNDVDGNSATDTRYTQCTMNEAAEQLEKKV